MKIAILLFGHMRTYAYCVPFLKKNLLSCYDCDVFIHTWDTFESSTLKWDKRQGLSEKLSLATLEHIENQYKPKKMLVESQLIKNDEIINSLIDSKKVSFTGMQYMLESLYKVNSLRKEYQKEKNIKYDLIIVTRPDIAIYNKLPLEASLREASMLGYEIDRCRFFAGLSNVSHANVSLMVHRGCDMLFWGKETAIDNFIKSNYKLDYEFVKTHFYNVVSVYVANEIKRKNIPLQVCFQFGKDWKNIRQEPLNSKKTKSKLYKLLHFYWLRGKK